MLKSCIGGQVYKYKAKYNILSDSEKYCEGKLKRIG